MATFEEKNRSLKLCQLVSDRQIEETVDAAIKELLIEGVDINFQDLNRNNNTPLHLATQKSDKNCVRLLVKYKPNLQIRNGSGETPFDVAQGDEVKELLSSASFDVVEKKFVHEIEFHNLSLQRLECLEADSAFKVLNITCCPNADIVWEKLNQEDFKIAIRNLSYLFFVAIETQEKENKNLLAPSIDVKRPIIVQITSSVSHKSLIYYKEENSKQLIEIKFHSLIGKDDFMQRIKLEAKCNFSLLIQALNSNVFGTFIGTFLDVKLNNDKNRSEIVNCFAKSNALCHRFFKLFDDNLTEDELNARLNQTLKFPGDQSLLALLDMPFEFKDEVKMTDGQKRILNFVDCRNYNLIMLATEHNNRDAVKTLLRFPIDLSHVADDNFWASDLCWEEQNWECLAKLIEAGSPYPANFDASLPLLAVSTAFGKIKSTMKAATSFHESIKMEAIDEVKLFIRKNPTLKHVYDSTNKSALTTALEYDCAEIYSLLLSEGFTPGVDDEYHEAFNNCNVKDEIRDKNRKYFKNAFDEPHPIKLLNQCKLSFNSINREACSQDIQNMFFTLNEIPEMVPILQIVSCSEKLNIVFDFDCDSVREMDPTKSSSTEGVTYNFDGFIYIGAKKHREGFFKVIGTLAHELTHYAMQLTFENNCKPYAIDDKANQEIFKSIVDETRKLMHEDTSTEIRTVFTYFRQEMWHQKLIAQIPYLLARYKNAADTLEEARHKNFRLFDFFLSNVLSDVKAQTKVLMHKLEIRNINSLTGTIEKIKKYELQLEWFDVVELEDQIIGSNAPQLTLGMLRQSIDESSHVFISIEQISYENIRERIAKIEKKDFAIIVDCSEMVQKHAETICNVREMFKTAGKIFLVMADEETSIITTKLTNFKVTHEHHNWSHLTEKSKNILLQKIVNFQGTFCSLEELMNRHSAALLDLPLNEFCNSENFKIGDPLADPFHKFYLPRSFITRIAKADNKGNQLHYDLDTRANTMPSGSRPQIEKRIFKSGLKKVKEIIDSEQFETIERSLDEILLQSKLSTVVIISDSAGTGKTSTLHEIARRLNEKDFTRWTVLTDLKQHIKMFKEIQGHFKSFQDFVTNIILTDKPIFEKNLFSQFHQEGRTNILLDGFDEISPNYKEEVLKALKLFTPKSGNQLWITTRSHLELELEKTLDRFSFSLQPLTRKCQIEFLEKVWKTDPKSSAESRQQNLSIVAEDLVDKLSSICDSKYSFIDFPISISMVAEIFVDLDKRSSIRPEKLNFYSTCKQFVEKKINIWMEKGEIVDLERIELLRQSEGIIEVHRKIAIAHFFENEIAEVDAEYDDEQWTVEKLARFGLIGYDESKRSLSFIHETFAEYFLIDFILENLRTKTRACGAVKILVKLLTEKDFQVVRLFLDQALNEFNFIGDEKLYKTVGKQLNVMREEVFGVLLHISQESCEEAFKFMLSTIKHVEEQILLVNKRDEDGNNVLLINVGINNKTMIKTLFDFIEKNTNLENVKLTIQAVNLTGENVFHKSADNKNEEIFPELYESIRKILTFKEIKKMVQGKNEDECSVFQSAAAKCSGNALNDLMKILKELFSNEEMKEMFVKVKTDGDNSLHVAARRNNKQALKSYFEHVNDILNFEETKKLIQQRGFIQRNIFHSACLNKNEQVFPTLYETIGKNLTIEEIKEMLIVKDNHESSVFQCAVVKCNKDVLNDLMKILKELFRNEEMKEMFVEVNLKGENSLHAAVRENNKITLKSYFDHINDILNFEETRKLIQQRGFDHRNIYQYACLNQNEEIFTTLRESMQPFLTTIEIEEMLREKDEHEDSVLQCAAAFGNENALNDLVKILKELFSDEEMKEILFEVNKNGDNCLHVAAFGNNKIALKSYFRLVNEILNPKETKNLIQQRGFEHRNIFQSACFNKNKEIFPTLHECTSKFLEEHELKEMLLEIDIERLSILQLAESRKLNENAMNDLVKILQMHFSNEEMKKMFFDFNKNRESSLHAVARENTKIAQKSFVNLKETLGFEEFEKVIPEWVSESHENSGEDMTEKSLASRSEASKTEDVNVSKVKLTSSKLDFVSNFKSNLKSQSCSKEFWQLTDENNWSILHHTCKAETSQELQEVCRTLKKHLSNEELKSMFLRRTSGFGFTALMLASSNNKHDVLKSFWTFVKTHFDSETQKTILQQKDSDKNNFLRFTLKSQAKNNFSLAMNMLKETLETSEIRSLVLSKNKFDKNIWISSGSQKTLEEQTKIVWGCMPKIFDNKILKEIVLKVLTSGTTTKIVKRCILFYSDGILSFIFRHFSQEEKIQINLESFLLEEPKNCSIDDLNRLMEEFETQIAGSSLATTANTNLLTRIRKTLFGMRSPPKPTLSRMELNFKQYFLNRNDKNQTIFHFAALNEDAEVIRFLISNAKRVLKAKEFRTVIKVQDEMQQNVLFKALMNSKTCSLVSIFKIIEENIRPEFEEILSNVDKSGRTLLHYACSREEYIADPKVAKPQNVVEFISELFETHLRGKEKFKEILLQRDQKGKSALYYATYEDHKFLEAKLFHGIVTDEELNELLDQDDLIA